MTQLTQADFSAFMAAAKAKGVNLPATVNKLSLANDADPQPMLPPNGGIPSIVSSFIDPNVVRTVFANLVSEQLFPERRMGSWAQDNIMIQRVEPTGRVVAYEDYSEDGAVQVTNSWQNRTVYRYQTMVTYGELEQERMGLTGLAYAAEKQRAAAITLNQAANKFYFYGVAGIDNFGILNDPALPASISPIPDPNANNNAVLWSEKTVLGIYNDILALYEDLISRTNGVLGDGINMASGLTLAMSPQASVWFKKANEVFGNTVEKMVRDTFPNMKFVVAPQYHTDAGELVQMIATEVQGQSTGYLAYSDKLRAHPLITQVSSWKQKYSGATYGAVVTQPMAVSSLLGV